VAPIVQALGLRDRTRNVMSRPTCLMAPANNNKAEVMMNREAATDQFELWDECYFLAKL